MQDKQIRLLGVHRPHQQREITPSRVTAFDQILSEPHQRVLEPLQPIARCRSVSPDIQTEVLDVSPELFVEKTAKTVEVWGVAQFRLEPANDQVRQLIGSGPSLGELGLQIIVAAKTLYVDGRSPKRRGDVSVGACPADVRRRVSKKTRFENN